MPVLSYGHAPGSRGELLFSTHPAAPVFNPLGRTFSERRSPERASCPAPSRGRVLSVPITGSAVSGRCAGAGVAVSGRCAGAGVAVYRAVRRVTAHEAAATPPATVNTAGQAPTFLARGCEPAKAAT